MIRSLQKCWAMLTPNQRWRWIGLVPLAVTAAVLEAVGAGAVFALIKIIQNPSQMAQLPVVSTLFGVLPWRQGRAAIVSATVVVALFYIAKNVFLTAVAFVQSRVANQSVAALSQAVLKGYLSVPFAFHFRRNSAELIRNSMESVDRVVTMVLSSAVAILSEALVILGIVTVLMVSAPLFTLIAVSVLLSLVVTVLRLTRRTLSRWGSQDHGLRRESLQTLQQVLGALKEVKVRGSERFFFDRYSGQQHRLAVVRHRFATLTTGVRLLIETVFVGGLLLVVILVMVRGGAGTDLVSLLGLYAYAGFRVIPSVNRTLMYLSNIRYGMAAVDPLYNDFQAFKAQTSSTLSMSTDRGTVAFRDSLVLAGVSYRYDQSQTSALQDINLAIRHGESIGIVGPTGAGKSTLIDLVLGLLQPSAGHITADGTDIVSTLRQWQRKIGYVPQAVYLTDETLRRNIAFGLEDEDIDDERVRSAVRMAQLESSLEALPSGLDTIVGERGVRLSGGERQRVAIARALYHEPELLVFDEATSALDNQTERELTRAIEALHGEKTLLIIAHRLSTVRNCDRLVFLRNGRLEACGRFDELLASNTHFREMAALADDGNRM